MKQLDFSDVDACAAALVDNWRNFESFALHDSHLHVGHMIWESATRDSGLLDRSNHRYMCKVLLPMRGVIEFGASHWACGYTEGFSIRVYTKKGKPTAAFKSFCALMSALDEYPILDEDDYSDRVHDAAEQYLEDNEIAYSEKAYQAAREAVEE